MRDTDDLPLPSPGNGQTKSGSASFKNELTKRFGSKYRDASGYNYQTLMGEQMPLGKAFGILAICLFGPNLPTDSPGKAPVCHRKNAAKYAFKLNEDTRAIKTVLGWPDHKAVVIYTLGLFKLAAGAPSLALAACGCQ
jgi:hypothetical protein